MSFPAGSGRFEGLAPLPNGGLSLGELAEWFDCTAQGDADIRLRHVSTLEDADAQAITFIANAKYLPLLANARDDGAWVKIPQLGSVRVGNDVEIGANTTIDRGTLNEMAKEIRALKKAPA